jgi:hypothetical protein
MKNNSRTLYFAVLLIFVVFFVGCKENSTEPKQNNETIYGDAAITIAGALGEQEGGAIDQIGDISEIATPNSDLSASIIRSLPKSNGTETFTKQYDPIYQKWRGTLNRERLGLNYYVSISRIYEWQFLKGDVPQQYYIVGSDTATTISFKILRGSAYAVTPFWRHIVDSLSGNWTITNANDSIITINGTAYRTAIDTLRTVTGNTRTLDNELILNYTDITARRGNRAVIASTASGTISGTYNATVTFQGESLYAERNISRDFVITFSNGIATITVGGRIFNGFDVRDGTQH